MGIHQGFILRFVCRFRLCTSWEIKRGKISIKRLPELQRRKCGLVFKEFIKGLRILKA